MSKTIKFTKDGGVKNVILSKGVEEQLLKLGWKREDKKRGRPTKVEKEG